MKNSDFIKELQKLDPDATVLIPTKTPEMGEVLIEANFLTQCDNGLTYHHNFQYKGTNCTAKVWKHKDGDIKVIVIA